MKTISKENALDRLKRRFENVLKHLPLNVRVKEYLNLARFGMDPNLPYDYYRHILRAATIAQNHDDYKAADQIKVFC